MTRSALLWAIYIVLCFLLGFLLAGGGCHAETLVASFYGSESGTQTASGETFRPGGLTCAHKTLPFGTRLRVCLKGCVVVRVTDRGPFIKGRSLDLSSGAARVIGLTDQGVARVEVERL